MARMGRPPIEIDWKKFEGLCRILCTEEEICAILECDRVTLSRKCKQHYKSTFEQAHKRLSENGRCSLRRAQYKLAIEGNPTMLIWLGKQQLKQREPSKDATVEAKGADGSTVKVTFNVVGNDGQLDV